MKPEEMLKKTSNGENINYVLRSYDKESAINLLWKELLEMKVELISLQYFYEETLKKEKQKEIQ